MNAGTGIDYVALVDKVLLDERCMARANELCAKAMAELYTRNHKRQPGKLRISDAGGCVLNVWADVHDAFDLPESPRGLRKIHDGSRAGVEYACLIVAGIEWFYRPYSALAEVSLDYNGIPGHCDVLVRLEPEALEVVEIKRTGSWKFTTPEESAPWYLTQACAYAQGVDADTFVVLVDAYAAKGDDLRQFRYATDDWVVGAHDDYERLGAALGHEPPEGDAAQDFRCVSCRYSACERNRNVLRDRTAEARAMLERQLAASLER